jgi:cerevisin
MKLLPPKSQCTSYVIDTGIYIGHSEFEGRARWGKTIPRNDTDTDDNGHGTHCAGIIGSRKYGIAKKANLIAVKAFRSDGVASMEDIVGGVTWAANDALARKANAEAQFKRTGKRVYKGAVANMSFGGGKSEVLDRAVNAAVASGLHAATAAGNDHQDACESSPARATEVVTAGASSVADEMAYFSNHGPCVDIFAPGM